jgi:hypothetical protein
MTEEPPSQVIHGNAFTGPIRRWLAVLWVPKTCVTWADALRGAVGLVQCSASAGPVLAWPEVG